MSSTLPSWSWTIGLPRRVAPAPPIAVNTPRYPLSGVRVGLAVGDACGVVLGRSDGLGPVPVAGPFGRESSSAPPRPNTTSTAAAAPKRDSRYMG
jgi:hypothetical protein